MMHLTASIVFAAIILYFLRNSWERLQERRRERPPPPPRKHKTIRESACTDPILGIVGVIVAAVTVLLLYAGHSVGH